MGFPHNHYEENTTMSCYYSLSLKQNGKQMFLTFTWEW